MSVTHFLAMRYLKSTQENRFFSWITVLSTVGIAIGCAALIVVLSVVNGFESELRKRFLQANAHIMAYRYPAGLSEPEKWMKIISDDFPQDVKAISPFVHSETMAKHGATLHGVLVRGVVPKLREEVQSSAGLIHPENALAILQKEIDDLKAGTPLPRVPSIVVGNGLLGLINAKIGDELSLVAPERGGSELKTYKIIGTYESGLKHYDNRLIVMSLSSAQAFFNMGEVVTGLEIGLKNYMNSVDVESRMQEKYNLTFREWQSFNQPLFEAMQKERLLIGLVVALVSLVAAFNILTTVFVSVSQKQKDISILKSLGATNRQIVGTFINQSIYVGVIGGALGGIMAVVISWWLDHYLSKLLDLPDPYVLKNLPIEYSAWVYAAVIFSSVILCIAAGIYPAVIASRIEPSAGFRGNEGVL